MGDELFGIEKKMIKKGIITSRKCPTCGHHEVGYMADDRAFHPLRPGDVVQVLQGGFAPDVDEVKGEEPADILEPTPKEIAELDVWVPEPLKCDRALRLKYGVRINRDMLRGKMSGSLYEIAYIQKLQGMLENEKFTPLPIIFDRFFAAPHLATGSPKRVAETLLRELDEVKAPVTMVKEWLVKQDDDSLLKIIHPLSIEDLTDETVNDEQLKDELEALELEEFLEML